MKILLLTNDPPHDPGRTARFVDVLLDAGHGVRRPARGEDLTKLLRDNPDHVLIVEAARLSGVVEVT